MMAKARKGSAGPGLRLAAVDGSVLPMATMATTRQAAARADAAPAPLPPKQES